MTLQNIQWGNGPSSFQALLQLCDKNILPKDYHNFYRDLTEASDDDSDPASEEGSDDDESSNDDFE